MTTGPDESSGRGGRGDRRRRLRRGLGRRCRPGPDEPRGGRRAGRRRTGPGFEEYVAARVLVSGRPAVRWEAALFDGQDERLLGEGGFFGFGVDAGTACCTGAGAAHDLGRRYRDGLVAGTPGEDAHGGAVVDDPATGTNLVAYPSGRDADGAVTSFVADVLILNRAEPVRT
jgi:hypothetical protein